MSNNTEPTEPLALPAGVDRVSDLGTLLTLKQSAEMVGLSVKTVRRMIARGELLGAHQTPMSSGKGLQWVVPYSELIKHQNTTKAQAPAPSETMTELLALREQVARLEAERNLLRALADERANSLEQLHTSFRALMPAQNERTRKKLFRR
jgi:predicted DNA-binding transcriptional regulator YafY